MLEPISDPLEAVERDFAISVAKWIRDSHIPYDPAEPPLDMDTEPETEPDDYE